MDDDWDSRMYRKEVSQERIINSFKDHLHGLMIRPKMYAGESLEVFYGMTVAYVDAIARACSGYNGFFIFGQVPKIDDAKSYDENVAAIRAAVHRILDNVPREANRE